MPRPVRHDADVAAPRLTGDQRNAFMASFLGWTMDAFDYFLVVLVYADIATTFHHTKTDVAFLTTATLAMRPVGALLFGLWADRVGRRVPLMVDVSFYSVIGFLCAFAPNFTVLVILRLLYGIGMGGEWGLGAALSMEKVPAERRGVFSGLLQEGYAFGYLLASVAALVVMNWLGLSWRWLFGLSIIPALISLIIRYRVKESEVWEAAQDRMRLTKTRIRDVLGNPRNCAPVCLPSAVDDRLQLDEPRHPGCLPDLPDRDYRSWCRFVQPDRQVDSGDLQHRRHHRRSGVRHVVPAVQPPLHHRFLCGAGTADRAAVRLLAHCGDVVPGFVFDASLRTGCLGCDPRASDRDVARRYPGRLPRRNLPAR